ncbi:hypothetical protein KEM55_005211 [Ascosphaera atra]|nr:hypothetical protein KEM55_005211 [Ascosphaera atra]
MDKAHAKACEAIEPFVAQATSTQASPRFIANLISSATSSPSAYVFAELLEIQAVQSLRSPDTPQEYRAWLRVLEIFAWGTWKEYESKLAKVLLKIINWYNECLRKLQQHLVSQR